MKRPARALGRLGVFCLGLNAIIGSGIFLFPGTLAALALVAAGYGVKLALDGTGARR